LGGLSKNERFDPNPLSGATVPTGLQEIQLAITVAGRLTKISFPPQPNLSYHFAWDGLDAYGRRPREAQPAIVRIGYVYEQGTLFISFNYSFSNFTPLIAIFLSNQHFPAGFWSGRFWREWLYGKHISPSAFVLHPGIRRSLDDLYLFKATAR
jgi:hypothetical protein